MKTIYLQLTKAECYVYEKEVRGKFFESKKYYSRIIYPNGGYRLASYEWFIT